jgi:hypothetical protein
VLSDPRYTDARPGFDAAFAQLVAIDTAPTGDRRAAPAIVDDVRSRGDAALLEYTNRFDRMNAPSVAALEIGQARCGRARGAAGRGARGARGRGARESAPSTRSSTAKAGRSDRGRRHRCSASA